MHSFVKRFETIALRKPRTRSEPRRPVGVASSSGPVYAHYIASNGFCQSAQSALLHPSSAQIRPIRPIRRIKLTGQSAQPMLPTGPKLSVLYIIPHKSRFVKWNKRIFFRKIGWVRDMRARKQIFVRTFRNAPQNFQTKLPELRGIGAALASGRVCPNGAANFMVLRLGQRSCIFIIRLLASPKGGGDRTHVREQRLAYHLQHEKRVAYVGAGRTEFGRPAGLRVLPALRETTPGGGRY